MHCTRCTLPGHNAKSCKVPDAQLPQKTNEPKRPRGRPRKNAVHVVADATISNVTNAFVNANMQEGQASIVAGTAKRGRGRPPKSQVQINPQGGGSTVQSSGSNHQGPSKGKWKMPNGFGVIQNPDTGNIFVKMPGSKRGRYYMPGVDISGIIKSQATTSTAATKSSGRSTQESTTSAAPSRRPECAVASKKSECVAKKSPNTSAPKVSMAQSPNTSAPKVSMAQAPKVPITRSKVGNSTPNSPTTRSKSNGSTLGLKRKWV
ncbi:hypothetical protein ACHQM5_019027 [Ranunculus cassubicifolius]